MATAQITIGKDAGEPQEFSVLELLSDPSDLGGLRMPHLTGQERQDLENSPEFQAQKDDKALGLTIYNEDTNCIEFWNGTKWISSCTGEVCPTPNMPGRIIFNKTGPLRLNETFIASVEGAGKDLTYNWTIPPVFSINWSSLIRDSVELKAISPGIHSLYNIGVTATNDCGNTSASRSGMGYIKVLNCETEPQPSDIVISKIVTTLTNGSGTQADPYIVIPGQTFTLSYPDTGNGLIVFNWMLSSEGNEYFEMVSQGNGTIILTAKKEKEGEPACSASAIQIIATNECGNSLPVNSQIHIKIEPEQIPCPKPEPPGPIVFSKDTIYVNETFTATVPLISGMTYTWTVPQGLVIAASNTDGNVITIRAIIAGQFNRSGISVTATNDCGNTSNAANGTGILVVKDPKQIPPGPGNLRGKICFDIAKTNSGSNGNCGRPEDRFPVRTDFENRDIQDPVDTKVNPPYSGIQVYTFTPPPQPPAVTNVRFLVDDPSGKAVESYQPSPSDPTRKLIIYFRPSLNQDLIGVSRENAWKVYVYALYTVEKKDYSVKLTLYLQDCACCGAKTPGGGWLNFMCHNLGADESLDPFIYSPGIKGDLYQWGRKSDKHELRTSPKTSGPASGSELDAQGQVQGRKEGQFLMFVYGKQIVSDWRSPSDDTHTLWTDNPKAAGDPCPPGWKVPSRDQWAAVIQANNWVWTSNGRKVGDALFLPTAGTRSARPGTKITGDPESVWPNHPWAYYWSSTGEYNSYWKTYVANELHFSTSIEPSVGTFNGITYRNWGESVRCVEDLFQ